jgi:hypothetical protein
MSYQSVWMIHRDLRTCYHGCFCVKLISVKLDWYQIEKLVNPKCKKAKIYFAMHRDGMAIIIYKV